MALDCPCPVICGLGVEASSFVINQYLAEMRRPSLPTIDWTEHVGLYVRGQVIAHGAPAAVELATGPLHKIIRQIYTLPLADRATLWIEGETIGRLSIFEILSLSMREDFPLP